MRGGTGNDLQRFNSEFLIMLTRERVSKTCSTIWQSKQAEFVGTRCKSTFEKKATH